MQNIIQDVILGLIPDWVWPVINLWPWIVGTLGVLLVLSVLYRAYTLGGWPAVSVAIGALGVGLGYFLGVRSQKEERPPTVPLRPKKPLSPKRPRKTIGDIWNERNDRE